MRFSTSVHHHRGRNTSTKQLNSAKLNQSLQQQQHRRTTSNASVKPTNIVTSSGHDSPKIKITYQHNLKQEKQSRRRESYRQKKSYNNNNADMSENLLTPPEVNRSVYSNNRARDGITENSRAGPVENTSKH